MKKILVIMILLLTTIGCELFDAEEWAEYREDRERRGRECYRDYKGYFYCEDTKQEIYQPTKFPERIRNYGDQENGCLNRVSLPFSRHNEYSEEKKFCEPVVGA